MLNERSLQIFLQVFQTGNLRLTAQKLYISPQSVSKTILDLEEELQEKLFVREWRRLIPTRRAVELKKHAERILKEYQLIRQRDPQEVLTQPLKVYCTYGVVEYLGAEFVKAFQQLRPDLLLYLIELPDKQALELLRQREPSIAILSDPSDRHLFDSRFLCVASYSYVLHQQDPLARQTVITNRELAGHNLVGKGDEFQLYINQMSRFAGRNDGPHMVLETTSYHLAMQMAKAGFACAFVPSYLARTYAPPGTVVVPAKKEEEKEFYLVSPLNAVLTESARSFAEFLIDWTKRFPPE